ncbi:hypothetical protein B0H67DRAFT_663076 [Lasiosphaeris hirsuta]|uniref:Uncharacterized protein n=1 Tax=Lasiosphaeris hirsuta TaxID=260670 RepID=A0AA40ARF1_9PEZI|nr:hypothetical protein B0H67DRAFT_663076 [Lasiosphaeris hirsuta]
MSDRSHLPLSNRGQSRIRTSGLRIRTNNFSETSASNVKAKGIASADWRRTAIEGASSGSPFQKDSMTRNRRSGRSSSEISSPFMVEMEDIRTDHFVYYRPREDKAPWEMIVSAPAHRFPSTSSSLSGTKPSDGIPVQFKSIKQMTMNVNGEEITLSNSFVFDVVPVEMTSSSRDSALSESIGELRPVIKLDDIRRSSSPEKNLSNALPSDLLEMLSRAKNIFGPKNLPSSATQRFSSRPVNFRRERTESQGQSSDSGIGGIRPMGSETHDAQQELTGSDQTRFQNLVSRLQNAQQYPCSISQRSKASISDPIATDPAIVAVKVKDGVAAQGNAGTTESTREAIERATQQLIGRIRTTEEKRSGDSGYWTGGSGHSWGTDPSTAPTTANTAAQSIQDPHDVARRDGQTQRLNPTAAEFRSTFDRARVPVLSPKKITRTPLTNLFPQASPSLSRPPPSGFGPGLGNITSFEAATPNVAMLPEQMLALLQRSMPPATFGMAEGCGVLDLISQQIPLPCMENPDMAAPPASSAFDNVVNPFSSLAPAMVTLPVNVGALQSLSGINEFSTFPGATLPPLPTLPGTLKPILPTPTVTPFMPPPAPPYIAPSAPLFGPDRKINRPHFPVTQKPRDHDPIKQQQYEAYLEWRKANEPGYHMKCKMRQAQRVVRQYQQKHQQPVEHPSGNPEWKAIVEKAKAAVGAAAAAAAAEKKKNAELVRSELKAKVQERSEDSARAHRGSE